MSGVLRTRLRTRLRSALLIALAGFVLHLLRNVPLPGSATDQRPLWLFFSGCEIAILALVSAWLWSRRPLGLRTLRLLELVIFGTVAAYIAGMQLDSYHVGFLEQSVVKGQQGSVYRLVGIVSLLRWCLVIVLYGTFIPNTWRRCAAVVGSLAAIPVALMVAVSLADPVAGPYVLAALPESFISGWPPPPRSRCSARTSFGSCTRKPMRPSAWGSTGSSRSSASAAWAPSTSPNTCCCAGRAPSS
jgi:hypothetical protein